MPKEFNFANEADFVSRLLIPLFQKLGFGTVIHFHGTREFGKDLILGEIDKLGHVTYHGLQAKYSPTIGLATSGELIEDAKQAFANPFRHPYTGSLERVSLFYIVNGGSYSDQAKEHFYNSLALPHGGHARLLDGEELVRLDRTAAMSSSQETRRLLGGILLEIGFNRHLYELQESSWRAIATGDISGGVPQEHYRTTATTNYLNSPFLPGQRIQNLLISYCMKFDGISRIIDRATLMADFTASSKTVMVTYESGDTFAREIEITIREYIEKIGPQISL